MARALSAAIALLLLLPALALVVGPAGAQIPPEVTFTSLRDYPVDTDNSGLFNKLVIEVKLEVTQEGSYTVLGILKVDASGNTYTIDTVLEDHWLEEGENTIELEFPSEPIFRTGKSGSFRADIEVQKWDHAYPWNVPHHTPFYDHNKFQAPENPPPVPPDAPIVEAGPNSINISTDYFQVFVNRTSPVIVFRYRDADPAMPDFVVTYYRLIMFNDDGNHIYNGEDPTATVLLTNYPWVADNIEVSGPVVSFDLKARVPVPVGPEFVSADITLTFTVTNGTISDPGSSGFIRGDASELKVDMLFEPVDAIPGSDHLAFEYRVRDTKGSHDFLVEEPVGYQLYPRTQETGFLAVPRLPDTAFTQVGLVNDNLVWHAFIGWQNLAEEAWSEDDDPLLVDVGGSFRVRTGQLELYNSFPYSEDLIYLDHDPSVGTVEENRPPEPPPPKPPEEPKPNPYVFWFAVIAGAVIILLTVYARAQGY
ncbi:MAG: hypothetical protein LN414_06720 [Candidatus Thermoplasmatota archaeon]|nr:hypothetical protein [Candidatus Thermoplasmatota archaeon]